MPTHNDQTLLVKHVLGPLDVFFSLFEHWVRGGFPKVAVHKRLK